MAENPKELTVKVRTEFAWLRMVIGARKLVLTRVTVGIKALHITGPEGSRKLRPLDFLTTAQYGGRLSVWYSFSLGA